MFEVVTRVFPGSRFELFGSVASGFWNPDSSDVDISVMIPTVHARHDVVEALKLLSEVFLPLGLRCTRRVFRATVPIIKLEGGVGRLAVAFDLSVNNVLAIQNSDLLKHYSHADERVHPLVMLVKSWAKLHGKLVTVCLTQLCLRVTSGCLNVYVCLLVCVIDIN